MKKIKFPEGKLYRGDCLKVLKTLPDQSVDLVITSPPYEDVRTYGKELEFNLSGDAYVEWCLERYMECLRVCKGLVAWVIEGKTRKHAYTLTPFELAVAIKQAGGIPRKPFVYRRNGIPGSGGNHWMRNDWEPILAFTREQGPLPWVDNTACGTPPKYGAGGAMSNRKKDGTRENAVKKEIKKLMAKENISQREAARRLGMKLKTTTSGNKDGDIATQDTYVPPDLSNPGNVIDCGAVGGGHLGSNIAHLNDAPFPEKIPDFFIRSFCPPEGVVLDPFVGSGTTIAVAIKTGRRFIGIDLRKSQIELCKRRIEQARANKGLGIF